MTGLGNTPAVSAHIDIGPRPGLCRLVGERLGAPPLQERATRLAATRAAVMCWGANR